MSIISDSNEQQKLAITHENGPLLIIAGAGTGKTRVITARIAWLIIEKNLKIDEVLALTFTEKAAAEMEERVDLMLPYGYVDLWISTFHAFCDKLLKRHAIDIGLPNNYKLLTETEAWMLVRKNLGRFNLDYYRPLGNPAKFIHALLKHFSRCKDEGISPADYLRYAEEIKLNSDSASFIKNIDLSEFSEAEKKDLAKQEMLRIEEVANAFHVYNQILLENEALDFGDLINYAIALFKTRPQILAKYRNQFKYILIDEYQDTNYAQYELIKMLAAPKNNLTVVGDDDQAIFKFRGASISNIMQFKKDFPDSKETVLTENYRSCQEILDLAYKFIIQNNPYRLEAELGISKKLKSNQQGAGIIKHFHEKSVADEAQATVNHILKLKKETGADWSEFAILVRANESANIFIRCLEQASVPYQFMAMRGLYNKPLIIDLINYLKLLDNYHESSAMFRVLSMDLWAIKREQIALLAHVAKQKTWSMFEAAKNAATISGIMPETLSALNKIIVQIEKGTQLARDKKPLEILLNFLHKAGLLAHLQKQAELVLKENFSYLNKFCKKIQSFEADSIDPRLADLMEFFHLEMESGDSGELEFDEESGPEMVKILTVHSAKGLEFNYVFLPNMVDRKFPTDERSETIIIPNALIRENIPEGDFHLHEERRLFYVAMTRAKKGLFFSSADNYGGSRDKKLSRFLIELGYAKDQAIRSLNESHHRLSRQLLPNQNKPEKNDVQYQLPHHFSFSQMKSYETCPQKYKFENILKIPVFGNHYFTFGTVIHETLQKFLEQCHLAQQNDQQNLFSPNQGASAMVLPFELLNEIYDQCWKNDWYQDKAQKDDYYTKGKDMLKNFYENYTAEMPTVKFLEQVFNIKINRYNFTGRIDRIDDVGGGQVEIIDYKTGLAPKNESLSTDERRQLLFYQIVAEDALKLSVKNLKYYFLDQNKFVPFIGKAGDKLKLKERFLDNIRQIECQNFEATPSLFVCQNCEYKDICEYRKI